MLLRCRRFIEIIVILYVVLYFLYLQPPNYLRHNGSLEGFLGKYSESKKYKPKKKVKIFVFKQYLETEGTILKQFLQGGNYFYFTTVMFVTYKEHRSTTRDKQPLLHILDVKV